MKSIDKPDRESTPRTPLELCDEEPGDCVQPGHTTNDVATNLVVIERRLIQRAFRTLSR